MRKTTLVLVSLLATTAACGLDDPSTDTEAQALGGTGGSSTDPATGYSITAVGGGRQQAPVNGAFELPLLARVTDASGNPVAGAEVAFTAPEGAATAVLSSTLVVTDASGEAQVTATASGAAGTYNITAVNGQAATAFTLTNAAAAPASIRLVAGGGQSATVTSTFGQLVTFQVRDIYENPVGGATVSLATPADGATAATASSITTDAGGLVQITATAGTVAGSYALIASVDQLAASASLHNLAGAPEQITIDTLSSPQATEVNMGFAEVFGAIVTDRFGNPTPNVAVDFTGASPGPGAAVGPSAIFAPSRVLTDAAGRVETYATANGIAGSHVATASIADSAATAGFALTNLAGAPATVAFTGGSNQRAEVDTDFTSPLAVIVTDADGNPVPGTAVTFTAPSSGPSAVLAASSVATDANGRAAVTARAGTLTGAFQVAATVANGAAPAVYDLANTPGKPELIVAGSRSTPQQAVVGTAFVEPLVARVMDHFGNAVPGVPVTYAIPTTGATGTAPTTIVPTDGEGLSSLALTAGTTAGRYQVIASVPGSTNTAIFEMTNRAAAPQSVVDESGDGQRTTVDTAFADPLVVRVTDEHGNPVAGTPVTFIAPETGATATSGAISATTDENGRATATITAGTVRGTYDVLATTAEAAVAAKFTLTNDAGAPAALTADAAATPQAAEVLSAFTMPLTVIVADRFGNRVPGALVQFGASSTGPRAVLELDSALTDDDGTARVRAVAGPMAGNFEVYGYIDGVEAQAIFSLTQIAASPAAIVIDDGAGQRTLATTNFARPVTFHVVDSFGNPIAGAPITITTPANGPTVTMVPGQRITEADGSVAVLFTAGEVVGEVEIVGTVAGAAAPAIARVTVDAIPTATVATVVSGSITVTMSSTVGVPTGDVELLANGVVIATAPLTNGSAELMMPVLPAPTTVIARYPAQRSFAGSTSESLIVDATEEPAPDADGGCSAGGSSSAAAVPFLLALFSLVVRLRRRPVTAR